MAGVDSPEPVKIPGVSIRVMNNCCSCGGDGLIFSEERLPDGIKVTVHWCRECARIVMHPPPPTESFTRLPPKTTGQCPTCGRPEPPACCPRCASWNVALDARTLAQKAAVVIACVDCGHRFRPPRED